MGLLNDKAKELLAAGTVQVIIGYGKGSGETVRAMFARKPEDADKLICTDRCTMNLAVYLNKAEVKALGKAAVVCKSAGLRTILQFASENRLKDGDVIVLAVNSEDDVQVLESLKGIEECVASRPDDSLKASELLAKIEAMSMQERWDYWQKELSRCIKCYACRAACPMCYCERCVVECNQPQWMPVASHALGTFEWHVVRAMHLAGRCVNCNSCFDACPVGIPLNVLTQALSQKVADEFGMKAGFSSDSDYAMSTYKPEDREDFIR